MSNTVSRYRSQRKQAEPDDSPIQAPAMPTSPSSPAQDASVARSQSRYHRKTAGAGQNPPIAPAQPEASHQMRAATSPQSKPARYNSQKHDHSLQDHANVRDRQISPSTTEGAPDMRRVVSNERSDHVVTEQRERLRTRPSVKQQKERQTPSQSAVVSNPQNGMRYSPPQMPAQATSPTQSSSQEPFSPPKKPSVPRDEAPKSQNIGATKTEVTQPAYEFEKDDDSDGGGCFGLFKRKRQAQSLDSEKTPAVRPTTSKGERDIKAGGGGIVPGIDAPVSAVNAGDRRVRLQFGTRNITLPVTPTTAPIDLIKSASIVLTEHVEVKSAVLLEDFSTVGVQRPLRRYEHVRDIMNSWDYDQQNKLVLVDPGTGSSEVELNMQGVPDRQPGDESWFIHYSQKPGKWDRRYITLRQDGQLLVAKDPDKPRDAQNLCHLSDFDIYTPTQDKMKKKIKPPKKYCYAIKSQQKSSMFESSNNFVHFVSTAEKRDADSFYAAVQGWRSWYLVNVMGEGSKDKNPPPANAVEAQEAREEALKREDSGGVGSHHKQADSFDSHYQLGSFQPLIDMDVSAFGEDVRPTTSKSQTRGIIPGNAMANAKAQDVERARSSRRRNPPSTLRRGKLAEDEPLANLDRKRTSLDYGREGMDSAEARSPFQNEFADTGLLGRSYSQKRKDNEDRDVKKANPWTLGPNLLNGGVDIRDDEQPLPNSRPSMDASGLRREKSVRNRSSGQKPNNVSGELGRSRSTRERGTSIDLQRSGSRKASGAAATSADPFPPRPLVDLTPQYREPPQHQKKGHGHKADNLGPGGLINAATSPDDPLGVPPSVDWRGRNSASQQQQLDGRPSRSHSQSRPKHSSSHGRSGSQHRPTTSSRNAQPPIPFSQDDEAFTGEGLLAGNDNGGGGWGSATKGRGVMDGSHARGPMVDLSQESKFVQGSLLNKVERDQGGPLGGLVIDREKRKERVVAVGEGY